MRPLEPSGCRPGCLDHVIIATCCCLVGLLLNSCAARDTNTTDQVGEDIFSIASFLSDPCESVASVSFASPPNLRGAVHHIVGEASRQPARRRSISLSPHPRENNDQPLLAFAAAAGLPVSVWTRPAMLNCTLHFGADCTRGMPSLRASINERDRWAPARR